MKKDLNYFAQKNYTLDHKAQEAIRGGSGGDIWSQIKRFFGVG